LEISSRDDAAVTGARVLRWQVATSSLSERSGSLLNAEGKIFYFSLHFSFSHIQGSSGCGGRTRKHRCDENMRHRQQDRNPNPPVSAILSHPVPFKCKNV